MELYEDGSLDIGMTEKEASPLEKIGSVGVWIVIPILVAAAVLAYIYRRRIGFSS
jgi:hypothetical protein